MEEGKYVGSEYDISFNKLNSKSYSNIHKGCDAFISVDITPFHEKVKERINH